MNLAQLEAERTKAGAEYSKAIETLRTAYVRVSAVERTLRNGHVAGGEFGSFHHAARFRLEEALRSLQHAEFAPQILGQTWHDRAVDISDKQIEGFEK